MATRQQLCFYSYRTGEYPFVPYSVGDNIDNNKKRTRSGERCAVCFCFHSGWFCHYSEGYLQAPLHAKNKGKSSHRSSTPMQTMQTFSGTLTSPHSTGRVYFKEGKVVADEAQQVYPIKSDNNTNTGAEVSSEEVDIIPFTGEVLTFYIKNSHGAIRCCL